MADKAYHDYVFPIEEWPIYKLSNDRENFVNQLREETINRILESEKKNLSETLARVIYLERIRTIENPWKVDPPHELAFWNKLRKQLLENSLDKSEEEALENNKEILTKIVNRYANEIPGRFKIGLFKKARNSLTWFFNRLLSTASNRNLKRFYGPRRNLQERLKINGEVELIQSLAKKGTLVVMPTHFSNLDSILVGWALDSIGLPAFIYGAGLNLYNASIVGYFFNRLGAYKLDRRKKNAIYLKTLKTFSDLAIQRGTHSLFFPGGTRERSGSIEKKLKLGLMGTVTEAQRAHFERGEHDKIFVVPLVICYNFVLEAPKLIDDFLKKEGEELYIMGKRELSLWGLLKFVWQLFSSTSEIQISFGKPLDVMGNFVSKEGVSLDKNGSPIDLKEYFLSNGKVTRDHQRDVQYTKILGEIIVDRFHRENIVLSSHVVAFVAFNLFKARNPHLDLFGLVRLPKEDAIISYKSFWNAVDALKTLLLEYETSERLKLSTMVKGDIKNLLLDGIKNQGIYHSNKPLRFDADQNLVSDNMKLLFYYHNRLTGYDLESQIKWNDF
ncbi:MAG: 1-acyl-sn-glycerol-3-phosphate acyltransferase [Bacteroidota bacterium]